MVLALNGQPTSGADQLRLRISQMPPGSTAKLQIWRDGKTQDVDVTLGELPAEKTASTGSDETGQGGLEGVNVQELTPDIAHELNLPPAPTAWWSAPSILRAQAAEAGLDRGNVIEEVNHKPVTNIEQYKQAVAAAGQQPVLLLVNQNGVTRFMVVQAH